MLTTAGVTREATASVAWSSANRGSMLALLIGVVGLSGEVAASTCLWPMTKAPPEQMRAKAATGRDETLALCS